MGLALSKFESTASAEQTECHARFQQILAYGENNLKLGSKVRVVYEDKERDAYFLGRLTTKNGADSPELAFYEPVGPGFLDNILLFDPKKTQITNAEGKFFSDTDTSAIVKPREQPGPNCAAFAAYNCLQQLRLMHGKDDPSTPSTLKLLENTEGQNRLVRWLNEFLYKKLSLREMFIAQGITRSSPSNLRLTEIFKKLSQETGYKYFHGSDGEGFSKNILNFLQKGWPVVITYKGTGRYKDMSHAFHQPHHIAIGKEKNIYYAPRTSRNESLAEGGHAVVALGIFEAPGSGWKVLIADSNYPVPILWDYSELQGSWFASMELFVLYK